MMGLTDGDRSAPADVCQAVARATFNDDEDRLVQRAYADDAHPWLLAGDAIAGITKAAMRHEAAGQPHLARSLETVASRLAAVIDGHALYLEKRIEMLEAQLRRATRRAA